MTSPPTSSGARTSRLGVLRHRNFTLLWIGQITSNSGSWMQIVAQGWLVYDLTRSPFYLGVVGMARAIPMILLPPMGGVIADRLPRLKLLKFTQTLSLLLALLLAVLVSSGLIEVWQIVLLSFLSGSVNAFDQPTRQALLPDLVTREDLGRAVALNSSAWQGAALFGPTLAGVTVATIGVAGAFYANAASFLAVVAALFLMRGVPELTVRGEKRTLRGDLFDGLGYVSKTNLILTLLLLSAVTNIFGRSYTQLLPAFARDVFDEGSLGLGLLMSAPGAGTLVGAAVIAILSDVRRKGVVFFAAMLVFSAILVVFAINRSFALALGLLFLSGIASLVFSTMLTTMLQLHVTNEMRGRVMSLVTVTMQGFAPFGALLTGALATRIGIAEAVALSAVVVGVAAVVAAARARNVRDFTHDEAGPELAPAAGATIPAAGGRLAEPRQPL